MTKRFSDLFQTLRQQHWCKIFMYGLFTAVLATPAAHGRPEYALTIGQNRCTTCHYSPAGGGPRNLNGKYYGSAGYKLSPFSAQPYAGGEFKLLYYKPEKASEAKGGLASMNGSIWAAIPLRENESGTADIRIVGEQNLGGFASSGPRHLFLQYAYKDETRKSFLPSHYTAGRMIPPFGLMTDEHRTYVRIQTISTWNVDLRTGFMASGQPVDAIHYDLAVLNGVQNPGNTLEKGRSTLWGYLANLRWMPSRGGFLFGLSGAFYEDDVSNSGSRSARAAYAGLSLKRWTGGRVPATVLLEYDEAVNMNSLVTGQFVSDGATSGPYSKSLAKTDSRGYLAQINYDLGQKVQLTYKYDQMILDTEFPSDAFERHGFGIKHYFGPNMWLQMRYEKAAAHHPNEEAGTAIGDLDAFWSVVSVAL